MSTKKRGRKGPNVVIINSAEDLESLFFIGNQVLKPSRICRAEERREFLKKMEKVFGWSALLFEVIYYWIDDLIWWIAERQENQKDLNSL
jgi:hypothetical protein